MFFAMNDWIGKWLVFIDSESALLASLQALLSDLPNSHT